jgi:hypothetical protein
LLGTTAETFGRQAEPLGCDGSFRSAMAPRERALWMLLLAVLIAALFGAGDQGVDQRRPPTLDAEHQAVGPG